MVRALFFSFLFLCMMSCGDSQKEPDDLLKMAPEEEGFITSPEGYRYKILEEGYGPSAKEGEMVEVSYIGTIKTGEVFKSTYKHGNTEHFINGEKKLIPGLSLATQKLKAGGKGIFVFPPEHGYGNYGVGIIKPQSVLKYEIELHQVFQKTNPEPYDTTGINPYISASGLKFYLIKPGTGDSAQLTNRVYVNYTGYLTNGKKFDSSFERGNPISFIIGHREVMVGFEEMALLLNKGAKARVVIPYQLAYGEQGRMPTIPPKADLVFDVEMGSIKSGQ